MFAESALASIDVKRGNDAQEKSYMNLKYFRNHLQGELDNLPDLRSQEIQSHVLTTAILTRRIMEFLNYGGLEVPDAFDSEQSYTLERIINSFLHYRRFDPFAFTYFDETQPLVVRLYSDDDLTQRNVQYVIKIGDYFEIISRIAGDDLFVANDLLLPRVTAMLNQVTRDQRDYNADYLNSIVSRVVDTVELTGSMDRANLVPLPSISMNCHEMTSIDGPLTAGVRWRYKTFSMDSVDFIKGFNTTWGLSPFTPSNEILDGIDSYGIQLETEGRPNRGTLPLFFVVQFEEILKMCEAIRNSVTNAV